jgi:hypothetical protein
MECAGKWSAVVVEASNLTWAGVYGLATKGEQGGMACPGKCSALVVVASNFTGLGW